MADAVCGPSNPLQTFQKQTSVDRTLQQDRLIAGQSRAEAFRSATGRISGTVDAEFEAFQAAHPLEAGYPEPQYFSDGHQAQALGQGFNQPQPSNWASDFQNIHLSETLAYTVPQSQLHQHGPPHHNMAAVWHQDFLRQQNQPSPYQSQQQQRPAGGWAYDYTDGLLPQHNSSISPIAQQKQPEMQMEDNYDQATFERAFEAAGSEFQFSGNIVEPQHAFEDHMYNGLSPETEAWMDHSRLGSDRVLHEAQETENRHEQHDEADELARTAGQLLENVQDNQSQKFQESNFLSFMRQLRDKEVRVEGDKFVDVSQPLHPGGENYPNDGYSSSQYGNSSYEYHKPDWWPDEKRGAAIDALKTNGIDPANLSEAQLDSFAQQNTAVQQKSIEIYRKNLDRKERQQDTAIETLSQDRKGPRIACAEMPIEGASPSNLLFDEVLNAARQHYRRRKLAKMARRGRAIYEAALLERQKE